MKAVILAAGIGSRLQLITSSKPKCMVKVAAKPILRHQIEAFVAAGIKEIIIVVGYRADFVENYCKDIKNINIRLIHNKDYATTNNMYSLYLTKEYISGKNFVLLNGDVVLSPKLMSDFVGCREKNIVACDINTYNDESMKITVNSMGYINAISKSISQTNAYAISADLYKFSDASSAVFFDKITHIIEKEKNLKYWTEVALDELFQKQVIKVKPFDISGKKWIEIDNYKDLADADMIFSGFERKLKTKKLFFIDLDGTVYIGDKTINGIDKFLNYLDNCQINYYFLTNNSSRSKSDYVTKLGNMGIKTNAEMIILSTDGTVEWLKNKGITDVYVVGTNSMKRMFTDAGLMVDSNSPEYVILGYDTELTYEKIKKAGFFLQKGIGLVATHCDVVCPTTEGPIPDIGSMLAIFETALKVKPVKVFGKPNKEMVEHIIKKHKVRPEEVAMIGDRIYTDMKLARSVGCDFICVLSGETTRQEIEDLTDMPDLIVPDVGRIADITAMSAVN